MKQLKKILLTIALLCGFQQLFAQNTLEFSNETAGGIVGPVEVIFNDNTSERYTIGAPGVYLFQIGKREVAELHFGKTVCKTGQTVKIELEGGSPATAELKVSVQDEARSFSSIIR